MIDFEGVAKAYPDGSTAVEGVSFSVPIGQFCVVLGASGAGKSTLLRMVNGLVEPTRGRVRVDGMAVGPATLPALRPRIGMIHQQFNLVLRASVATNVISGALPAVPTLAALAGLFPERHRGRACDLLAAVGLEPQHLRRRADALSGGQQQRVGIARAFMLEPDVVLADEPVASLDPRASREVLELLRLQARSSGAAVVCSLHQLDLAAAFADRIVALRSGRLVFDGRPDELTPAVVERIYGAAAPATGAGDDPQAHLEAVQ